LFIGPRASVQFAGRNAIVFRVIRPVDRSTYEGWVWLEGWELNPAGDAFLRREIFVQVAGLLDWETVRRAAVLRRLEQEKAGAARRAGKARNGRSPGSGVRRVPVPR
jgi:hypothetical protein